jgi:hypothetical protein
MLRILEKMARDYRKNCETFLDRIERHVRERQQKGRGSKPISDLLAQVWNVKNVARSSHDKAVAWEAFELGRLHKEAKFEDFVPDAQRGWNVRHGSLAGSIKAHGTAAERKKKWRPLVAEFARLRAAGHSKNNAYNIMSRRSGTKPTTIRHRVEKFSLQGGGPC